MYGSDTLDVRGKIYLAHFCTDAYMTLLDPLQDTLDLDTMIEISRDFDSLVAEGSDNQVKSFRDEYPATNLLVVAKHILPKVTAPMRVAVNPEYKTEPKSVLDEFPDPRKGRTFKEYFASKYGLTDISDEELIVPVKQLKSLLNAVNVIDYDTRKKTRHKPNELPQSLCCRHPVPSYAMWRSLCLLPSVFYTVKQVSHAREFLGCISSLPSFSSYRSSERRIDADCGLGESSVESSCLIDQKLKTQINQGEKDPENKTLCFLPDPLLLSQVRTALVASSALEDRSNEVLEFYGDAVLKYVTTVNLFLARPDFNENRLNFIRSHLVSNVLLHRVGSARQLERLLFFEKFDPSNVASYLALNSKLATVIQGVDNERSSQSQTSPVKNSTTTNNNNNNNNTNNNKMVSDAVEALIGALFNASQKQNNHNRFGKTLWLNCLEWFGYKVDTFCSFLINGFRPPAFKLNELLPSPSANEQLWDGLHDIGLNYTFQNKFLLAEAFCHGSYQRRLNPWTDSNQRLEFVGDAVLEIMVTTEIIQRDSSESSSRKYDQGVFSTIRSAIVCTKTLAVVAARCGFHKYLKVMDLQTAEIIEEFVNKLTILPNDHIFKKVRIENKRIRVIR